MSNKVANATLTAILAIGIASVSAQAADAPKTEKCYGVAKAGLNDCNYGKNGCAGSAKTDGEKGAWITTPKGTCDKIVGGSTIPPKE
ncbi:MAG: DUF2282 domain-containing protein [Gammaproteobacteria bacterium]|nr:DUF2282 domain-containing protein [Gammaproteobacteria bacterium]